MKAAAKQAVEKQAKKAKKKKKGTVILVLLMILILLLGVGIIAYPTFADWWNSMHQSRAIAAYVDKVNEADDAELEAILNAAQAYNAALLRKENPYLMTEQDKANYLSQLDIIDNGVMGYLQIESIGVNLPIYHTTDESVLQVAIGHIDWSSLPVGGESTHCLLSGHRGLPSARLFTDLPNLQPGDRFTITVLRQTLTYQVDQIRTVEPHEVAELTTVSGKDYCTLITCTPYGINTHRLLVRGVRVENDEEAPVVVITGEAVRIPNYITIPAVGIPMLFLFLTFSVILTRKRRLPDLAELQAQAMKTKTDK